MTKYKDERLQAEMQEMQAKVFRYMIACFVLIFIIKQIVLSDYNGLEKALDNFI